MSQAELARRIGVTQGAIAKIANGSSRSSSYLHKIAHELQTSAPYLEGDIDDPYPTAAPPLTPHVVAEQLDSVLVPLYDLSFAMGDGLFFDETVSHEMIPFKREWLRERIVGRIDQVMMIKGKGDSMKPTIDNGDILLVNRAETDVNEPDLIWAFGYGDTGMVKRLRRLPKGGWLVQSDNQVVREFKAADDEVSIVGRVVSILRWQ